MIFYEWGKKGIAWEIERPNSPVMKPEDIKK